jgi:hypothetical protein
VIVERRRQLALLAERLRQKKKAKKDKRVAAAETESSAETESFWDAERIERVLERWGKVRNRSAQALAGYLRRAVLFYRLRWVMVAVIGILLFELAQLYGWADRAVAEPLDMLAEKVIPRPDVSTDLMAPLPPGWSTGKRIGFPYVLACARLAPDEKSEGEVSFSRGKLFSLLHSRLGQMQVVRFPAEDGTYDDHESWRSPKPYVLGDLAAPLPPAQLTDMRLLRGIKSVPQKQGATPWEEAQIWRARLLLTR